MGKLSRHYEPEHALRLPPRSVDGLPRNHLMFILLQIAAELDLDAQTYHRQKDPGREGYDTPMVVVLALNPDHRGLPPVAEKREKTCWQGATFPFLAGHHQPTLQPHQRLPIPAPCALNGRFVHESPTRQPTLRAHPNQRYAGLRLHRVQTARSSIAVMAGCSTTTASRQPLAIGR